MARIESGKETLDEEPCNIMDVGKEIVTMFAADMEAKGVTFIPTVNVAHENIYADETKLRKIMLNLLSNAGKYTPSGGTVSMTITERPCDQPGYVIYENVIEDNGVGMSKEFLKHLFEPFVRERNTTESKVIGTGLGMPIVKTLVELMRGTIAV
ncbi:MAG: HAMP domain-containing sensor histidine kinase [Clostridia bacterium]|nr:HAMP domain-containing sensor histidine kinase [Clostridia bacterium]